jgi:hypothetical protein
MMDTSRSGSAPIGWKPKEESMNSPRTLFLSIAATACGFILALVVVIGHASIASTSAVDVAMAPGIVSSVTQDTSRIDPVLYAVAPAPATSRAAAWSR